MSLENLLGQLVRVKDRRVVGKKHRAILLAVSRDGSRGYLRLCSSKATKIEARPDEILPLAYGAEMARRVPEI